MPAFVCAVDTNILFMKDAYYIKFKNQQLKYIPGRKGLQDNIILKMDRRMTGEDAFSSVTEFLSALSYSWSALFDTDGGFINNIKDLILPFVYPNCHFFFFGRKTCYSKISVW